MPPRIHLVASSSRALRSRPGPVTRFAVPLQRRCASGSSKDLPTTEAPQGPNQGQLPHVSEEASATAETMGETRPDVNSQATPVQEVLERDAESKEKAPEVIKQDMNKSKSGTGPSQSRSYSTTTRRRAAEVADTVLTRLPDQPFGLEHPQGGQGHKFGLPSMPMPRTEHFKRRYNPVVEQLTKSLMRHGKLSVAQTNMSIILDTLRTAPPPQVNPARPLLGSFPPAPVLPLSPIEYLTAAIDSLAPLVKIRQQRGMAGGGASVPIPIPLGVKQRRRTAMQWILSSADKRKESRLADRVAREIISVAEGKSSAWERRAGIHKMGITARSNIRLTMMGPRRKR